MKNRTRQFRHSAGLSVLELTVALGISAITLYAAVAIIRPSVAQVQNRIAHLDTETELVNASRDILKVGRLARTCARVTSGTSEFLECQVDRNLPPTGVDTDDTHFRFGVSNNHVEWLIQDGTSYRTYVSYPHLAGFTLCDDAMMATVCTIPGDNVSTAHAADRTAGTVPVNKFFRFRLTSFPVDKKGAPVSVQSAFTVRYPSPDNLVYQWVQVE